jgi:tetratricopeptide (TPR) repeat protein
MRIHPPDVRLRGLGTSAAGEPVTWEVHEHVSRCPRCQERLEILKCEQAEPFGRLGSLTRAATTAALESTLLHSAHHLQSWQAVLQKERAEATGLLTQLLRHPPERRLLLVRNHPRFLTWGLLERLLEHGRDETFRDARQGEELARLALELSAHLDAERYGREQIEDLSGRACAYLGNALRVGADLSGAEQAFQQAFLHLRRGTREPMERAVVLDLKASLLRAQRRLDDALRLLRRSHTLFLAVGERHRAGRSLVKMSTVYNVAGRPEKAIETLRQAVGLIDPETDTRLLLAATHNLIDDLADAGRFMEARKLLAGARDVYRRVPEPWVHNRRRWLEAKIAYGLGQKDEAEALLCTVRAGFLLEDAPYDQALVSLELAKIYAEQGRTGELRRIAEEMMPIFAARQIHREALAALTIWKQAVETERAGAEFVANVAGFLRRARYHRDLRFQEAL